MIQKLYTLLFLGFVLFMPATAFSQLDTRHYVPPVYGREDYGTHYIVLSTPEDIPFDVTITDGSGALITTQTISSAASSTYTLGAGTATEFLVEESELNTAMSDHGLVLEAEKPFFVNIRVVAGPQAGSLTSKGVKASLGQEFRTGHLFNNDGDEFRKASVFGIMATEDNTTVTIDDIRPGVIFFGTAPSGSPLTSPPTTFILNEGESYVVAAYMDEPLATENINGVNGTRISSDKDIVVNTGQWLGGNALVGGSPAAGRDLGIDQIVPVANLGSEYVMIKGEGIDNEKIIVVGTVDGTDLFLDGSGTATASIDAGDYYVIDGTAFSANDNLLLESSNDVYVYQSANGGDGSTDDNERQVGLNFLPPVGCSGSKKVVLPEVDFIGLAYINIVANAGSSIYVDGTLLGPGDAVTGTSDYVTYKLTSGYTGDIEITSDDLIRVALINISGNIGAAGYFSGFTKDVSVLTETVLADGIALEGCTPATFTFSLDGAADEDTEICYEILGTATNGIDYEFIDTCLIIPEGSTDATIIVNAISDGFFEGPEYVYIVYQPDLCSELDTAVLEIQDSDPITFSLDGTDLNCFEDASGIIDVDATGGYPPYTYYVTTDAGAGTTTTYTSDPITDMDAGTYSVQVYDSYGCFAQALVIGGMFDADTTFLPDGTGDTYSTTIDIDGFGAGEVLDDMSQLQQICMTMEHSYIGDLEIEIVSPSGEAVILKQYPGGGSCDLGEPFASGPVDGADSDLTDPGTGFEYCFNDVPIFGTMVDESDTYTHTIPSSTGGTYTDNYLPAGSYTSFEALDGLLGSTLDGTWTLNVTDNLALDNGYIFNWNIALVSDLPDTLVTLDEPGEIVISDFITEATCGGSDGAINIAVDGDFPPFTYAWSNGETTEDISGLSAGTYTVFVTDDNGCVDSATYELSNTSSINISTVVTTASCVGSTDGAIDVTTSGGTPPYSWSWSSGEITEDLSAVAAGTYTLTITDAAGCIYIESITIPNLPPITINLVDLDNEECGTGNGAINISAAGGSGSYGFDWDSGEDTEDISGLSSGDYTVTVTDANGCIASAMYTVINDVSACSEFCYLDAEAVITDEECGNGAGMIDVTISDATFPYTVSWDSGETVEDISGLSAGDYTITINDAAGCEQIETFTVENNTSGLDLASLVISDENCGNGDGAIDISLIGGSLDYSYDWSTGATTEDISGLSEGTYSLIVIDGAGCEFTTDFEVENNTGIMNYSAIVSNEVCGSGNGSINLTVTGAIPPLSYSWSSGPTSEDLSGLSAGTYSCTITDATGCTLVTEDFEILDGSGTLEILSVVTGNEDCDNDLGFIDLSILGGSPPYSFAWSSGETTEDISGLSEGTYSAIITDDIGCEISTGDLVIYNAPGDLDVTVDIVSDEICGNGEGAIFVSATGGTAPLDFSWSDGSTSEDNADLSAGSYTLTITDAVGCLIEVTESVDNTAGTLEIDNALVTDEVCGNGTGAINMVVSGGTAPYTYSWSSGETTEDISGLSAGSYDFTVIDANGCEQMMTVEVSNEAGDLAQSFVVTAETCGGADGAIDLTITGGTAPYTFSWSSGPTSEDLSGLSAGTYSCTITDNAGCSITTGDIVVANNPGTLDATVVSTDETCGDGTGAIDLTPTGGTTPYTFSWSTTETSEDISSLSEGTYSYTVTDASGCEVTGGVDIVNNSGTLAIDDVVVTDENCDDDGGAIDISISGGTTPYTFAWSSGPTSEDLSGLNEGTYSCIVTDASGCSVSTGDVVVSNNPGTLTLLDMNITNEECGNGLGGIDITISGGTAPISYSWSSGATTEDVLLLSEGTYTCTITDATGCELEVTGTVMNDGGSLTIFTSDVTDENCSASDGAIDIGMAGGTTPYSFSWSTAETTEDVTGLSAGDYTVLITDAGGCSVTGDFTVTNEGGDLEIPSASVGAEICGNEAGSIDIDVVGGTAPLTFSWDSGEATEDISGLTAGDYTVTITDANGCNIIETFTVDDDNGDLEIVSTVVTDENCGDGLGEIDITFSGGDGPYSFDWDNGETTEDLTDLSAGTYNLLLTDDNGCEATTAGTVDNISGGFVATIDLVTDENCGDGSGAIDVSTTGGTAPYTYSWDSGETTEDISGLSAGTYTLTVTDATGCSFVLDTVVNNISGTLAISGVTIEDENCGDESGFIDITVTGGTAPYTFAWDSGETTEDISGLAEGTYNVTITDATGCVINGEAIVNNAGGDIGTDVTIVNEICGNEGGSIIVTASGGIDPYTFSWTEAVPGSCCTWAIEMFDSGTSWNGASVTVEIDGTAVGTFTVTAGGYGYAEFDVCDGETIDLVWESGAFDNEISFDLIDASGVIVFSQTTDPPDGTIYTGTASCPATPSNTSSVFGLGAGDYELTITDDVGCSITEIYTVFDEGSVGIDVTSVTDEFCDGNNGVIAYDIVGGTGPFTTTANGFTDGPPVGLLENLFTDDWEIITVDANGCTDTVVVFIDNVGTFETEITVLNDWCGQGVAEIDLTVTGGGSIEFDWDTGETSEDLTGLTAGTYNVTVIDDDFPGDCEVDYEIIVTDSTDLIVSGIVTDELCDSDDGAIDVTMEQETDVTYSWDSGETVEDLTGLEAGTYTLTVTSNVTGCTEIVDFTVNNNPDFTVTTVVTDEFCLDSAGAIDLIITGGGDMVFDWSSGETTEDISGLTNGDYSCLVTNNSTGCTELVEVTINNITTGLEATGEVTDELCGNSAGEVNLTVTGGTGPYSYSWSHGADTEDATGLTAGDYTVVITDDSDGCQIMLSFTVDNIETFEAVLTDAVDATCGSCSDGSIDISVNEFFSDGPYSFEWSNGETTEDVTDLLPGEYTVIVTSASGCTDTLVIFIDHDNSSIGLDELNGEWLIDLYPNPTMDEVTLNYNFFGADDVILTMTNALGEVVRDQSFGKSKGKLEMGLTDLESGVYFIHFANKDLHQTVKLIIAR